MSNDEFQQQNYWKSHKTFVTCFKVVSNQIEILIKEEYNKMTENSKTWLEQEEAKALKKMNEDAEKLKYPMTSEECFYENCDTVLSIERPNSQENNKVVILPIVDWNKVVKASNNYENKNDGKI